ncbi:microtubule-actin cross-linking factor 1 like protein [Danaus plexippus plexippus]|uniref:Microtubule-actin cross-linking factor 1 like protein n=1 Tax=Danaus plexippus plexippus TaxID=278856 RepID=A0A212EHC3_DANPL|nr:microtubule-actin cross-linking factor 1 like protein [Danaus plexippus plexippus]
MEFENDFSLKEWAKDKPLSILQLDPADRAVLRIAGKLSLKTTLGVFDSILCNYGTTHRCLVY